MAERKHKSNAERQRAYRQRRRNAHPNEQDRRDATIGVTIDGHKHKCPRRIFLGDWGNGPCYALDVNAPLCHPNRKCPLCDAQRNQ